MTARRFTDKPELAPASVYGLASDHPAMVENRTLFPSTVVEITEDYEGRLLVSGKNNRKLGERVTKGKFKGYRIFGLSLEERATCPADCDVRAVCYGNSMHQARRHRIGDADFFYTFLENEIREILEEDSSGLLLRLHVLGDFPNIEYLSFWADMLEEHPKLACYGYTHRSSTAWGGDEIAERLRQLEDALKDESWMPREWCLTASEVSILNVLVKRRLATTDAIFTIMYGDDADGGPDPKIIDVFICKMRPKLAPFKIEIETVWGQGYSLTQESRSIIERLKASAAAVAAC